MKTVEAAADLLERRPWIAGLALLGLVALATAGFLGQPPSDRFSEGKDWDTAARTDRTFDLYDNAAFVAVFGDVLDPANESVLRSLETSLEALPWVADAVTPWDVPGVGTLSEAASHPLIAGTMLVGEGRGMMVPIRAQRGEARMPYEWIQQLVDTAEASVQESGAELEIGVTGKRPVIRAQEEAFNSERWRFQIVGALLGFLIASFAFRNLRATLLAGLPPLVGAFVALGIARLFGIGWSGLTRIVLPLLVLTIGFTDSLHIVVAAARARREGAPDGPSAAREALVELTGPCALTSFTTAIGFASLATTGSSIVTDFGLSCAFATALSFACVMLTIPLLCRTPLGAMLDQIRAPSFEGEERATDGDKLTRAGVAARFVERGLSFAVSRPRAVSIFAVALTVGTAWVALGLRADRRVAGDMSESSLATKTLQRVDEELGGALPIHVRMDWDEGATNETLLAAAEAAEEILSSEPLVSGTVGPAQLAQAVRIGAEAYGASGAYGAPGVAAATAAGDGWALLALLPEQWSAPFLRPKLRTALLHARIPDAGSRELAETFERIEGALAAAETPEVRLELVGLHYAYLRTVDRVTFDLGRSLILAALLILVTLAIAFRSWRLGLASVVPNLLPLGASAAGLAAIGGSVDVSTLTALTLSLGIATDDTIHVLARWRRARAAGLEGRAAARRSVLRTYPALAVTTVTLTAAFGVLLTSSIPTIRDFGVLAATTLAVAFLADVWLLPALLVVLAGGRTRIGEDS